MPGDGPASEFYYDGKTMMAYAPAENLVAVADAPPTIDAALKAAFDMAAIYFPFTDLLVADPYAALTDGAILAFYIGPSAVVGGTKTDMVAWANNDVFLQIWIGADDKLPRRIRAMYRDGSAGVAPRDGVLELATRPGDCAGRVRIGEGAGGRAHGVREPRHRAAAGREADDQGEAGQGAPPRQSTEVANDEGRIMKTIISIVAAALAAALWTGQALGWASANRAGGSTSHSYGLDQSRPTPGAAARRHTCGRGHRRTPIRTAAARRTRTAAAPSTPTCTAAAPTAVRRGRRAHVSVGRDRLPSCRVLSLPDASRLPGVSDLSGLSSAGRGAVLLVGLLRLRGGRRRGRRQWRSGAAAASANTAAATSSAYAAGVAAGSANTAAATSAAYSAGVATGAARRARRRRGRG